MFALAAVPPDWLTKTKKKGQKVGEGGDTQPDGTIPQEESGEVNQGSATSEQLT